MLNSEILCDLFILRSKKLSRQQLYTEFLCRLNRLNDKTLSDEDHAIEAIKFNNWKQGIEDAIGIRFDGYYYLEEKFGVDGMKDDYILY